MSAPTLVSVERIDSPADGVRRVRLAPADGSALPAWSPGAHVELQLPNGLVRQYSLCGDPRDTRGWELAVLREEESRGGSAFLHEELGIGDELLVTAVRDHFGFAVDAPAVVLIAGGIGITPLLPMIVALEDRGVPWTLHYAGRRRERMVALPSLLLRHADRVRVYVSEEGARLDLASVVAEAGERAVFYACGPERLLADVESVVGAAAADRLRLERFRPREAAPGTVDEAFTVELAETGVEVEVPPGRSILEAVRSAGADVASSCEEGTCGSCETVVLDGRPDHRDSVLSELERELGETMMICVSRACGTRLVLEL
ncbi:PDR/VanB family oxidoreductase [Leucobacter allii]|uniref:PDR/VanB family oxidoreductase n=1 Tax=Leucobacter allii TaxID=2932247 RepID=A0ABY4FMI0_9MICO|nr:PDR/VanB family oxidoreductase [Leucobacter allii]UOQ57456.1 PDR/VanB family oxidoreductase [Leucobacter allii]